MSTELPFIDPTRGGARVKLQRAQRPMDLSGKVVGMIDNNKEQGDVILEIVVRSDGSVGSIRVRRSLAGGLDQRAIEAVRQWRFNPAHRHGTPVDVAVEVAVEFKLR